jgi:hypothetical protein
MYDNNIICSKNKHIPGNIPQICAENILKKLSADFYSKTGFYPD